jgi:hypothetical protein
LIFSTGKSSGLTRECEISQTHIDHKSDPIGDLFKETLAHSLLEIFDRQVLEEDLKFRNVHLAKLSDVLSCQKHIESLFFESRILASRAGGIGSIFTEKDPVMDFISLPLHPIKKPFQANEFPFPVKKDIFLIRKKFRKRFLSWNSISAAGIIEIFIKIFVAGCVPGSERPLLQCLCRIRDDLLPIDSNDPAKTLTGRARTDRAVEGEEEGFWF